MYGCKSFCSVYCFQGIFFWMAMILQKSLCMSILKLSRYVLLMLLYKWRGLLLWLKWLWKCHPWNSLHLDWFFAFKSFFNIFFSSQRNVSIGRIQFWYIPLFNFLVIRALSSFYCFFRIFWINAIWVATISDEFLFLLKVEMTYFYEETFCIFMALKISFFPRWIC